MHADVTHIVRKSAPRPSRVFDTYWKFAAERQAIFVRRLAGDAYPWTLDPILQQYKFTNAYRASDRTSQYLIRSVIYGAIGARPEDVLLRILLFKLFNKVKTWELLVQTHGELSLRAFDVKAYDRTLNLAMERGESIYSAAYIMPSGPSAARERRKHLMHLLLLKRMAKDGLFARLMDIRTMRSGFDLLLSYPSFGPFLSYQFITDVNYSDYFRFSEMDFVVPGPGARDGIRKCFESLGDYTESDLIRWVADRQQREFEVRELHFAALGGSRNLQLIDCQNIFCEVDKYSRVAHPEMVGITGRTRIKQKFKSSGAPPAPFYPPFWGINGAYSPGREAGLGQLKLL